MNILSIILLTATLINGYLTISGFQHRNSPGAISFGFLMLSIVLYCFGYAFEIHSTTLPEILFWIKVEYIGISFFPTFLILFSIQYVGWKRWLRLPVIITLFTISTLTLAVHLTNNYHHWFYSKATVDYSGSFPMIQVANGFWYWIHQAYSIISMFSFNILFLIMGIRGDTTIRRQVILIQISSFAPWVCYIVYITGHTPHNFDIIPFSFSLMGFIMAWTLFRYRIFDITPLAFENIFESMSDGVIIINEQNYISNFNRSALQIFTNLNPTDKGKPLEILTTYCPSLVGILENNLQKAHFKIHNDTSTRYFEASVNPIINKSNKQIGKSLIFRDITERETAEQLLRSDEIRLKNLNKTKDKLLSIIGHDLRGPMGNIYNLSLILHNTFDHQPESEKRRMVHMLLSSSEHSMKLIENLLIWAKSQTGGMEFYRSRFTLTNAVNNALDVLKPIASEKNISILNEVSSGMVLNADAQIVSMVLRNLISNAIKFTPNEGRIKITAEVNEKETIVRIADTGIGLPAELHSQLFMIDRKTRRNGTNNEPGTGLGLLLCKEFVEMHDGRIWAENRNEGGSVFCFTIPFKTEN